MAVGKPRGKLRPMYPVSTYDPALGRKRYIGSFESEKDAREADAIYARSFRGEPIELSRCPGCRKLFKPTDEWQRRCSARCEANIKKRNRRRAERRDDDHWVYTALNASMEVIYVGVTSTGLRRAREHGREKNWWPEVAFLKIEHYATRENALVAEEAGIALHRPKHNVLGIEPEAA